MIFLDGLVVPPSRGYPLHDSGSPLRAISSPYVDSSYPLL